MSRGTRPIQFIDSKGHVIPYNPSDNTSKIVYPSDLYRFYGSVRPSTAVTVAGWRISRETVDTNGNTIDIQYYNGVNDFVNVWNSGTTLVVSAITKANPAVVTVSSTATLTTGDIVLLDAIGGMTEVEDNHYSITVLGGGTNFSLQDMDTGADVDSSGYTSYTTGGTSNKIEYANPSSWS